MFPHCTYSKIQGRGKLDADLRNRQFLAKPAADLILFSEMTAKLDWFALGGATGFGVKDRRMVQENGSLMPPQSIEIAQNRTR